MPATSNILQLSSAEWQKITLFCERGQQINKPSSFGYNTRLLSIINNDTLSWQTKSVSLASIFRLIIGNAPKKRFRKIDSSTTSLWITIDATDKSVSFLFRDIESRNFWIKAITVYMSKLPKALYIASMDELQSALNLIQDSEHSMATINYKQNDNNPLIPVILSDCSSSHIDIPNLDNEISADIDSNPTHKDDNKNDHQAANKDLNELQSQQKELSVSTASLTVDYTSIIAQRQKDKFRYSAKAQYSLCDATSIRSTSDYTPPSSLCRIQSNQSMSQLCHAECTLIDVEEIEYLPRIEDLKSNKSKLYVLTSKIISEKLPNLCTLNIGLLLPSNDEDTNKQMIDTEVEDIYRTLYDGHQEFECIVLPKLHIFAQDLQRTSPEIFEYLQEKMQWMILQIRIKNESNGSSSNYNMSKSAPFTTDITALSTDDIPIPQTMPQLPMLTVSPSKQKTAEFVERKSSEVISYSIPRELNQAPRSKIPKKIVL